MPRAHHPFTSRRTASVAYLGENRLIAKIRQWLGPASPPAPHGIGDDCAVVRRARGDTLVTVDPLVFGRHFDASVPGRAAGAKLLKRNASDIAAMGGRPSAAVVALALDAKTNVAWLADFYRGLAAAARSLDIAVVGGDVAQADGVFVATLTLLGETTARVLTRQGARRGDSIYVTGVLGNSLASRHHLNFTPRLAEGQWLAGRDEVRSMMDVSDGLAKDLAALTPPAAEAALQRDLLPLRRGATLAGALSDGEDYELVFTVARGADLAAFAAAWRRKFPRTRLTRIGEFVARRPRLARTEGIVNLAVHRGYEHFR